MSTLKAIFELSGISFIIYQGSVRFSDEKVSLLKVDFFLQSRFKTLEKGEGGEFWLRMI